MLLAGALLLAGLIAALVGGAGFIRNEAGLRWALAQVPGLAVQGLQGGAFGDDLRIERLQWQSPQAGGPRVVVQGLRLQSPRWRWRPYPGAWVGLAVGAASARQVTVTTGPPSDAPPTLPASLRLPAELKIDALQVDELRIDDGTPLTALAATLHLGADDGARHSLDKLRLRTGRADIAGLQARIAADAPFAVQARADARALPGAPRDWQAQASVQGPLRDLQAEATLRGAALPGAAPARLDARARLAPLARWPLQGLSLRTEALNLADLADGAPRTRLAGSAEVELTGLDRPARVDARFDNALPGRWDQGQLPVSRLVVQAQGTPATLAALAIDRFDAQLADGTRGAGRWQGRGRWTADALELDTTLDALQPQLLHAGAPALRLSGPLQAVLRGLPGPATLSGQAPAGPTAAAAWRAKLVGELSGQSTAPQLPSRPLQARFKAELAPGLLQLDEVELRDGAARARGQGRAERQGGAKGANHDARWAIRSQGELDGFDPSPWWPAAASLAQRGGAHRLAGRWSVDASVAADSGRPADTAGWARAARGEARLELADSLLAGQPLAGSARVASDGQSIRLATQLQSADSRVALDGALQPDPAQDAWQLTLQLPRLDALAPWARLVPALAGRWPAAGAVTADLSVQGRWPRLRSDGQAQLRGLRRDSLHLQQADLRWRLGTEADAPWELQLDAADLNDGTRRLDQLTARVDGTRDAHRITLQADSPAQPPAWAETLLGRTAGGTRLHGQTRGRWQPDAGGGRWLADALQWRVGARAGGTPWFAADNLSGLLRLADDGTALEARLSPGRMLLPGGAALRWSQLDWQSAPAEGRSDRLLLKGELETLAVAPWLARLQPGMGWAGDLQVGATLELSADERFAADIVFERKSGDLRVTDELGAAQALGLTDLRVSLVARDGLWQFAQAAAGTRLGEMAGAQVLRTGAQHRWPAADTPMEGVLEMRVANLAAWGAWVPPGWRLGGNLRVSAGLGGRFGAPELRGDMVGSQLAVRNMLQGVSLTDGELNASLDGESVKVERFAFRGGDGTLVLTGGGSLGANPGARLTLTAEHFRWLGRVDRRLVASGRAELALTPSSLRLDGRVQVDEGLFDFSRSDAPTLDSDVQVRAEPGGPAASAAVNGQAGQGAAQGTPLPAALRNAQVDLRIALGDKLALRGRGLDARLRGDLHLTSPGGRLALQGTVRATDGTYAAYGQKLEIERGDVHFNGPLDNPRLDVRAIRPNLDIVVGVAVTGSTQNPRITLFSEPEMADLDKLSWMVLGRAPDGLGRADTALLQRAALALLAGEGEAPTDQLIRNLGLTDFSVRQTDGEVRETVVSLGKQLSRRWYVGYERSVNATTGTWQLVYRIAQRFTLRAQSGEDNSLDVIWSWRW